MKLLNFSEKEILERYQRGSHLGQGIERLSFKTVRCTKDFMCQGKLIYEARKEYKLWIVKYTDMLTDTYQWFTAPPMILYENSSDYLNGTFKSFYMVPIEVFQHAGEYVEKAPFYELQAYSDVEQKKIHYQLFVDVNDGMQRLIKPWSLQKSEVLDLAVATQGGTLLDYTIRGRFITNPKESHIVWLLRQRLGKKQYKDLFFDALEQKFINWNMYAPDAKMLPISSGQAMIHIGHNTVKADKYKFIYCLGSF